MTNEQKINAWLDEMFAHGDESNIQADPELVWVNDFVKNEFNDLGIEIDQWTIKELCDLYCAKAKQLDAELDDADE